MLDLRPSLQRILVVDDEPNVALFLQAALEHLPDCEVEAATSGEQALQMLERDRFDLLITDYKMPGMGGIVLASRVRELHPETVILVITAFADDELYRATAGVGVRQVVHKPVKTAEIRALASQALGRQAGR
jgi:CheY-like chemotaxis protein